jgi:hypothetical protein
MTNRDIVVAQVSARSSPALCISTQHLGLGSVSFLRERLTLPRLPPLDGVENQRDELVDAIGRAEGPRRRSKAIPVK